MKPKQIFNLKGRGQKDRPFFNRSTGRAFETQAAAGTAEIDLYDEIGYWGVSALDFRKTLNSITASRITLSINSPGGDVFDGIAMYNDLLNHPAEVEVRITGLAASAASLIAMAGDKITIAENSFLMIHNAWGVGIGNRNDLRELADVLEKIDGALSATYEARTGIDGEEISEMMDAETWLGAKDAVDLGFADATMGAAEARATFDLSVFNNVPGGLVADGGSRSAAPETIRDVERLLRSAGRSPAEAKAAIAVVKSDAGSWDANGRHEADQRDADHNNLVTALRGLLNNIAT